MLNRHRMAQWALAAVLLAAGCERAQKYLPVSSEPKLPPSIAETKREPVPEPTHGWWEGKVGLEIPIRFVADNDGQRALYQKLPDYWNEFPGPAAFMTAPVGLLSQLDPLVALVAQVQSSVIYIKVPRGLPDPTPHIPAANPPTYAKWLLGKRLFFDDSLLAVSTTKTVACATCHDPGQGFTVHVPVPPYAQRNPPSLFNVVYNRQQFWDGRVTALEEVLIRKLDDVLKLQKDPAKEKSPGYQHVWPGFVDKLSRAEYRSAFEYAFGQWPTADSAAKALATYMRTLLSGDSVYDRAEAHKLARKGTSLEAQDFELALPRSQRTRFAAESLKKGYDIFNGSGRCNKCHFDTLFTDHGFHNMGIGDSGAPVTPGKEPGRFAVVPYGLKDRQLIGAYRTPTLRNLPVTGPYMHDGKIATIKDVVQNYSTGIQRETNTYLDPKMMKDEQEAFRLNFSPLEMADLEAFLRSLQGGDVPEFFIAPPRK